MLVMYQVYENKMDKYLKPKRICEPKVSQITVIKEELTACCSNRVNGSNWILMSTSRH